MLNYIVSHFPVTFLVPPNIRKQLRGPALSGLRVPADLPVGKLVLGGNNCSVRLQSRAVIRLPLPCQQLERDYTGDSQNRWLR